MSRTRPSLGRRVRPPAAGRFGRRPGKGFGWNPSGGARSPSPYPPGAGPALPFDSEPDGPRNPVLRWLTAPYRKLRPVVWRRAAVWRRSPLIKGTWLPRSKLGRAAVALLSLVTLGSGLWGLVRSSALDVDHIEVVGVAAPAADAARAAAGIEPGDPLFSLNLAEARHSVEALPWVEAARVSRAFPNRVEIRVTERTPAAVIVRPTGGFAVLDATGRVLADQAERPPALPEVAGAGDAPAPGEWLAAADPVLDVVGSLPEPLRAQVVQATLTGDHVTVVLAGGPGAPPDLRREIRFGRADELAAKASALVALLERLGGRHVAYIDVRVPSAPVVGPVPAPPPVNRAPAGGSQ
jgi:cell division protein FtsQ